MNNTLLIQATAQEYESIEQLIKELDVPPRQVLIEAKIYSVDLNYGFSSDITAALQSLTGGSATTPGVPSSTAASLVGGLSASGGVGLSAAMLVGKSRELLGTYEAQVVRVLGEADQPSLPGSSTRAESE